VGVIQPHNLQGYNFNRYYAPTQGIPNPRIDLRVNLTNVDEAVEPIRRCLQGLVSARKLTRFSTEPRVWNEPEFVVDAHEMATACAFRFVDDVMRNQALSRALSDRTVEFMLHFLRLLFESMGLQPYIAWTYLRQPAPAGLDQVVQRCTSPLADLFRRQTRKADFLERFVHLFLNCTVSAAEQEVANSLLGSMLWRILAEG
jgi:hypothetical protein